MNKNNYLIINGDRSKLNAKMFINKEYIIGYRIRELKEKVKLDSGELIEDCNDREKINTCNLDIGTINSRFIDEKCTINFKNYEEAINYLNYNNLIEDFIMVKARPLDLYEDEINILFINPKYILEIGIENEEKFATADILQIIYNNDEDEIKYHDNINNKIMINENNEIVHNFVIAIELINHDYYFINYITKDKNKKIYFCSYDEAISYLKEIKLI